MKNNRLFFLLLVFILAFPVLVTGCRVETVKEHNDRIKTESQDKSEILSSLLESSRIKESAGTVKSSGETTYQSPETTEASMSTEATETYEPSEVFYDTSTVAETTSKTDVSPYESSANDETRKNISETSVEKTTKKYSDVTTKDTSKSIEDKTSHKSHADTEVSTTKKSAVTTSPSDESAKSTTRATTQSISTSATSEQTTAPESNTDTEYILVHLTVSCSQILGHPDLSTSAKLPDDGIIIDTYIAVKKNCTAFEALRDTLSENNISLGYNYSALYKTHYIYEIAGLNEKECGKYSGWKYSVNNVYPNTGCGNYTLSDGDNLSFGYVTDISDIY